jgi:transglutaminase-like putative cysteine protease
MQKRFGARRPTERVAPYDAEKIAVLHQRAETGEVNGPNAEPPWRKPLVLIMALFLALLMVATVIPYYSVRMDPEPRRVPSLSEIVSVSLPVNTSGQSGDMASYIVPNDPLVKQVATSVATSGCDESMLCQAKAEYYFVRDDFLYVAEFDDYIQSPAEMMATKGGDCDDYSVLLSSLLRAIGVPTKLVFIPNHVYVKAYIADAPTKYKDFEGWIPLDATCRSCGFGEIPKKDKVG